MHRGKKKQGGIYRSYQDDAAQQRFFEEEFVAKFNKEHNCKISVATFTDQWDIERFLSSTKKEKP